LIYLQFDRLYENVLPSLHELHLPNNHKYYHVDDFALIISRHGEYNPLDSPPHFDEQRQQVALVNVPTSSVLDDSFALNKHEQMLYLQVSTNHLSAGFAVRQSPSVVTQARFHLLLQYTQQMKNV